MQSVLRENPENRGAPPQLINKYIYIHLKNKKIYIHLKTDKYIHLKTDDYQRSHGIQFSVRGKTLFKSHRQRPNQFSLTFLTLCNRTEYRARHSSATGQSSIQIKTTPRQDTVQSGTQLRRNRTKYRARHNSATGVQYRVHNSATGVKHSSSTGHLKYRARQQRILRKGVRRLLSFVSVHTNNRPNPNNVQATRCIKSDKV